MHNTLNFNSLRNFTAFSWHFHSLNKNQSNIISLDWFLFRLWKCCENTFENNFTTIFIGMFNLITAPCWRSLMNGSGNLPYLSAIPVYLTMGRWSGNWTMTHRIFCPKAGQNVGQTFQASSVEYCYWNSEKLIVS